MIKKTRTVSVRKWLIWVEELSDVLRIESVLFGKRGEGTLLLGRA